MIIVETQCFPPISLFSRLKNDPELCIEAHENYQKRSYRNRICLASAQGVEMISIPLAKGKNEQQRITETQISYDTDWVNQISKVLKTNYGSAPFYEFYINEIMGILTARPKYLYDLNQSILNWLIDTLGMDVTVSQTESYVKEIHDAVDMRNKIRPQNRKTTSKDVVSYVQVHQEKTGFIPELSIIDMLFCCGPETISLL